MTDTSPIQFNPTGTITIDLDGDGTVTIGRPTFRQWRHFSRKWDQAMKNARADLDALHDRVNALKDDETSADERAAIEADIADAAAKLADNPLYEQSIAWLTEAAEQVGDRPLPEDPDDWPSWLAASATLPKRILSHWQTVPKVSGP